MQFNASPKIFENYKCAYPKDTIKKIEDGFKKLGLHIEYDEKTVSSSNVAIYSGYALIDVLGFAQNGKGTTHLLSKASAYAEIAERFSTGFMSMWIPFPKKKSEYRKLLADVTERQFLKGFTQKDENNYITLGKLNNFFHKPIDKDQYELFQTEEMFTPLVDAYSIISDETVKVPITFIEAKSTTNGLAAGNTLEEATAQASFEIFERYCANKVVSEKTVCPTIDPNTIQDEKIQSYLKMFESLNIKVILKDFTFVNKLPVIGALFINKNVETDENIVKKRQYYYRSEIASHCNLKEAIIRCFTEYLQNVNTEELLKREEIDVLYNWWVKKLGKKYLGVDDEFKYFTRYYDYYGDLSFLESGEIISFEMLKSITNEDSLQDVNIIKNICIENNWDMLVIDYTHKVLQFPTIRVVIPPISTDYDRFTRKCLKSSDFKQRFNNFYGIKDFFYYLNDHSWINDESKIKSLICNLENYLSKDLPYYSFYLTRENNFQQQINVLHILPFLYMQIGEKKQAENYFKFLLKLNAKPEFYSSYFKYLYLYKYNPVIYQTFIYLLNKCIENDEDFSFKFKSNPFYPDAVPAELEEMYKKLLKKLNDSY